MPRGDPPKQGPDVPVDEDSPTIADASPARIVRPPAAGAQDDDDDNLPTLDASNDVGAQLRKMIPVERPERAQSAAARAFAVPNVPVPKMPTSNASAKRPAAVRGDEPTGNESETMALETARSAFDMLGSKQAAPAASAPAISFSKSGANPSFESTQYLISPEVTPMRGSPSVETAASVPSVPSAPAPVVAPLLADEPEQQTAPAYDAPPGFGPFAAPPPEPPAPAGPIVAPPLPAPASTKPKGVPPLLIVAAALVVALLAMAVIVALR